MLTVLDIAVGQRVPLVQLIDLLGVVRQSAVQGRDLALLGTLLKERKENQMSDKN